ncbi:hypothetical protein EON65_41945 [archaeon]|nr:MAG: hypothetical protein EON65_41945 [archaeon]
MAREIHAQLKPEITTRVANRLIGAALNIRIDRTNIPAQSNVNNRQNNRKEEHVDDAWDS